MTKGSYAQQIAEFLVHCLENGEASEVRTTALRSFRDTVGVILLGSLDKTADIARRAAREVMGEGRCSVLGTDMRLAPAGAALANGVAAHAIDFDDTSMSTGAHASSALIPATIAASEVMDATMGDALDGYAIGFEVLDRIGIATGGPKKNGMWAYQRGWHGTSVVGTIGAAVASAYVYRLDHAQIVNALGIAASSAGGVYRNIGTMTKPYHSGRAAMNGILATGLAAQGFEAAPDALEGPLGFMKGFGGLEEPGPLPPLGKPFSLIDPGTGLKFYPIGSPLMGAVEGIIHLAREHAIDPSNVKSIRIGASDKTIKIARYGRPSTVYEARYSVPYVVAIALLRGKLTVDEFDEDLLRDPNVISLLEKVSVEPEAEFAREEGWPPPTRVTVALDNGQRHEVVWSQARGYRTGGFLSDEEIDGKYIDCVARSLSKERAESTFRLFKEDNLSMPVREFVSQFESNPSLQHEEG